MEGQSRSWVGMVVGIAIAVVVTGVLITTLTSPNIAAREAMASRAITTLTAAEADFRANDRDRNHVNDFWTGDVSGLYYLKPVDGGFELRLIDVEVANADARPIRSLPEGSGPRKGYRYLSLDRNDDLAGEQGSYRVDTDRSGRRVHHLEKFALIACPVDAAAGKFLYMANESNTVYSVLDGQFRTTWPAEIEFKKMISW